MRRSLALAALLATLTGPARAQSPLPEPEGEQWEGIDAFVRLLAGRGLVFDGDATSWAEGDPSTRIVIVLGGTGSLGTIPAFQDEGLRRFVHGGGALLFASDLGDDGAVLAGFHIRFGEGPATTTVPGERYGEYEDCPVIGQNEVQPRHPLFHGALPIVTNRPAFIRVPASQREGPSATLKLAAVFPPSVTFPRQSRRTTKAFLIEGNVSQGRRWQAIAISDHSVFINRMMFLAGYRNFVFARNVIEYLAQGKRTNVLVLYDGVVVGPLAPAIPGFRPPRRPLPPGHSLAIINGFLRWIDDARIVERAVADASSVEDDTFESLCFVAATVAAPVLAVLLSGAGFRARRRRGAEAWDRVVGVDPGRSPLAARVADAAGRTDRADALELSARRFFERTGLPRPPGKPDRVPKGWSRRRLRGALASLAAAADGRPPGRVGPRELEALLDWTRRIESSIAEGSLTFHAPR